MKTFFKFFVIFAIIGIAMASCEIEHFSTEDGKDGEDGRDGYSVFIHEDPFTGTWIYYHEVDGIEGLTSGDRILSQETKEDYKFVTVGDCIEIYKVIGNTEIFIESLCDGQTGPQGPAGPAGIVVFSVVPDTVNCKSGMRVVMTSLQDGEEISSISFCVPADGEDGTTVVIMDTVYVVEEGMKVIPFPSIQYLFDDGGSLEDWFYKDFSGDIDDIGTDNSPNENGTASGTGNGYFWLPEFAEPCSVLAFEADIDSRKKYKVRPLLKLSDGTIVNLGKWVVGDNPDFDSHDTRTYGDPLSYYVSSLEDVKDQEVIQLGFYYEEIVDATKSVSCDDPDWNDKIHFDNIRIERGKVTQAANQ